MESASAYKSQRLLPLDALRGLIMIMMAIDHANYFVARKHPTGEFWGIPLPQYDNIAELTRPVSSLRCCLLLADALYASVSALFFGAKIRFSLILAALPRFLRR